MVKFLQAALFLLCLYGTAQGEVTTCGEHKAIAEVLLRQWQEFPAVQAITGNGDLLEVYVSPSASWTVLLTFPNGLSCIMATGEDLEFLPPPSIGKGDTASQ